MADNRNPLLGELEAFVRLSASPRQWQELRLGHDSSQLGEFARLDPDARRLALRLLDHPSESDWAELAAREDGKQLAQWLLSLPVFEAPDHRPALAALGYRAAERGHHPAF